MGAVADRLSEEFRATDWGMSAADFAAKVTALEAESLAKTVIPDAQMAWGLHRGYSLSFNQARRTPETQSVEGVEVSRSYKAMLDSLDQERDRWLAEYHALTTTAPAGPLKKQNLGSITVSVEGGF